MKKKGLPLDGWHIQIDEKAGWNNEEMRSEFFKKGKKYGSKGTTTKKDK